jgi:ABC-type transport system involved in multi-copper enzyme maturation permease subunit
VILVPFDFFLFFSTIILHISGFFSLGYEEMLRIFFFVLIANLYILFFLALGFFLSTLFYSSAQSMSFALLLWAFVVFIIPNLIPITTNALFPIPSTDKFEEEKMRVFLKIKFEKNKEHPGSLGIDGLLEWESDIRKIEENFENKLNNFIDFTIKLERMFPVGSLTEGITKCMRTSIMDERRFISWVKRFRDKNALNSLLTGETEQFIYKRTNLSETLKFGILNDLLPLFVYIVFILIGIIISFNRYDVR